MNDWENARTYSPFRWDVSLRPSSSQGLDCFKDDVLVETLLRMPEKLFFFWSEIPENLQRHYRAYNPSFKLLISKEQKN